MGEGAEAGREEPSSRLFEELLTPASPHVSWVTRYDTKLEVGVFVMGSETAVIPGLG